MSRKPHSKLWLYFTGIIFATIFAVFALITAIWFALFELNLIQIDLSERHIPIVVLALGSILLGIVIAVYVGKLLVRPIQNISNAFNELSKGNFEIKVSEDEKIMENQEVVPNKTEYRLDEQLRKVILMLEGKWKPKNIEFDMDCHANCIMAASGCSNRCGAISLIMQSNILRKTVSFMYL